MLYRINSIHACGILEINFTVKQLSVSVLCCNVIDACTTSNDVSVKSKFVLNVMLEPKVDSYAVAIPPPRDRD